MPKFNTMFDVAFSIDHDCDDPFDIPVAYLIEAMLRRARELQSLPADEALEAFGACDTYEIPEKEDE